MTRLLGEAVITYREALKIYTREQAPQQWATTQDNPGSALRAQGERREPMERDCCVKRSPPSAKPRRSILASSYRISGRDTTRAFF